MLKTITAPFRHYNTALIRYPLIVKSVTSGTMYAGGDVIAQYMETYNLNKVNKTNVQTKLNKKRILTFFLFGTFIGGPAFHYWFNYLNELPAMFLRMKQSRHRGKILHAYAYLKAHGIDVKLDMARLPSAAPLNKWTSKGIKIAADQLFFSSSYTLVFFMLIGLINGALDKMAAKLGYTSGKEDNNAVGSQVDNDEELMKTESLILKLEQQLQLAVEKQQQNTSSIDNSSASLSSSSKNVTTTSEDASKTSHRNGQLINPIFGEDEIPILKECIQRLRDSLEQRKNKRNQTRPWKEIWDQSWEQTKKVYFVTYLTDCLVWPPLQLINFTFIPLRFQFLYVNIANIAWNSFLSLMANKKIEKSSK